MRVRHHLPLGHLVELEPYLAVALHRAAAAAAATAPETTAAAAAAAAASAATSGFTTATAATAAAVPATAVGEVVTMAPTPHTLPSWRVGMVNFRRLPDLFQMLAVVVIENARGNVKRGMTIALVAVRMAWRVAWMVPPAWTVPPAPHASGLGACLDFL